MNGTIHGKILTFFLHMSTDEIVVKCDICEKIIQSAVYILCCRCSGFSMCLECFSNGREKDEHLKTHNYIIVDNNDEELYQEGWSKKEEFLLLYGVQVYGLGNWDEIEKVIKTKTASEIEHHYIHVYFHSDNTPLPIDDILQQETPPPPPEYEQKARDSRPSISHEKNLLERGKKSVTTPGEMSGWMPRREEFETEYLNEAEEFIEKMVFSNDDTEEFLQRKFDFLKTYNDVLYQRKIRNRFALEWDLLDDVFSGFPGVKFPDKETESIIMTMAQVVSRERLTEFIELSQKESSLKETLNMYLRWKENGITCYSDGLKFQELENLLNSKKLTHDAVDKWNKSIEMTDRTYDTKRKSDTDPLSAEEASFCEQAEISGVDYTHIKDLLIRETSIKSDFDENCISSYNGFSESLIKKVFQFLKRNGLIV